MKLVLKSLFLALAIILASSLPSAADGAPSTSTPVASATTAPAPAHSFAEQNLRQRWYLSGLIVVMLCAGAIYRWKFRPKAS